MIFIATAPAAVVAVAQLMNSAAAQMPLAKCPVGSLLVLRQDGCWEPATLLLLLVLLLFVPIPLGVCGHSGNVV